MKGETATGTLREIHAAWARAHARQHLCCNGFTTCIRKPLRISYTDQNWHPAHKLEQEMQRHTTGA